MIAGWTTPLAVIWLLYSPQEAWGLAPSASMGVLRGVNHQVLSPHRRFSATDQPANDDSVKSRYAVTPTGLSASTTADDMESSSSSSSSSLSESSASPMLNGDDSVTLAAVDITKPSFLTTLWRFTRPHTIIGSALAVPALHILAAPTLSAAVTAPALAAMTYALLPALLMNLYVTGLNQITDVEIDKVNKPFLPIAAGHLPMRDAVIIVAVSLVASLCLGAAHPVYGTQGLNVALWGSGILGTLYSLQPFRLKRFPVLAAFCIVAVRGMIINASFFAHSKAAAFGTPGATVLGCLAQDSACFLSSLFFGVFGVVIALMKDVPDVAGDELANIRTFSVRLGQKRVFHTMRWLLTVLFTGVAGAFGRGVVQAPSMGLAVCRTLASGSALAAAWSIRQEAQKVNPEDSSQVYDFYMHLWKLFYLSYFVLPFAR